MRIAFWIALTCVAAAHAAVREPFPGRITALAVGREADPIAAAWSTGRLAHHVTMLDLQGRAVSQLGTEEGIYGLSYGPSGKLEVATPRTDEVGRVLVACSPDGRWVAYQDGKTKDVGRNVPTLRIVDLERSHTTSIDSGVMPARHRVRDFVDGLHHVISNFDEPCGPGWVTTWIEAGAFAPDASRIAVAIDRRVRIFAVPSGARIGSARTGIAEPTALAYSRDGRLIAVAGKDRVVILDGTRGTPVTHLVTRGAPTSLAFSPDGRTLAIGSYESVELRDLNSGARTRAFAIPGTRAVAFSAQGARVAAGGAKGLWLWNVGDGRRLMQVPVED